MAAVQRLSRRSALIASASSAAALAAPGLLAQTQRAPLQIVGPWEITGLTPASSGYIFTRLQVTETLLNASDDGTPQSGLATRWTASGNGLVWRFELRPTARFHDGTSVTASAVARCLNAARTAPALLSLAPLTSIETDGANAVVVKLSTPFSGLLAVLSHSSTAIMAPASYNANGSLNSIIGSGPYRIGTLNPPAQVDTLVFENYDGPKPQIERVRYQATGRVETRALMAEGGQADLAYQLDPASLVRLRKSASLRIESVTLPRTMILKLNAKLPALQDVRVRRALSLAIDRPGIAKALLRDPELAATQLFAPSLPGWHNPALGGANALRYDPQAAARLLLEAGWQRSADGLRKAGGPALSLALRTFPDRPELPIIASALQAQFKLAGIAMKVSVGNSGDIPLGHRDGSLQLGLAARNYGTLPDLTSTLLQDFATEGGDWGAMGWRSERLLAALAELSRGTGTVQRAAELRGQITSVLQDELPVIPIAWYRQQVAVNQRVEGVSLDPLERSYRLTQMRWRR
jgi:peptide/nickel transport system substrate-binding protein